VGGDRVRGGHDDQVIGDEERDDRDDDREQDQRVAGGPDPHPDLLAAQRALFLLGQALLVVHVVPHVSLVVGLPVREQLRFGPVFALYRRQVVGGAVGVAHRRRGGGRHAHGRRRGAGRHSAGRLGAGTGR